MLDTTFRPLCFGIDRGKPATHSIDKSQFKKYEYALYICAQLSRIVYTDSGIIRRILQESFGKDNATVNSEITKYDKQFSAERRTPVSSQAGDGKGRPAESYSLNPSDGSNPFAIYISSPSDCSALVVRADKLQSNNNNPFNSTDIFVSFKGSSTIENFKHDLLSQFTAGELKTTISPQINIQNDVGNVPTAFVTPIVGIWSGLLKAIEELVGIERESDDLRLIITGHSLGGAFASLFAFIIAEFRGTERSFLDKIKSIHLITFGAPTILSDKARNNFNKHLDTGFITLDRVVSQAIAARSAATQVAVGGILGPNDVIPNIPVGFAHPGFRPLTTEFRPEAGGRPYQMMNIRNFFIKDWTSKTNGPDPETWPFSIPAKDQPGDDTTLIKQLADVKVTQEGGGLLDSGKEKSAYSAATKSHLPNFVSVQGSKWAAGFAHAEYLGMFFLGAFRLPGMKNPASNDIAYFKLNDEGVKITYLNKRGMSNAVEVELSNTKEQTLEKLANSITHAATAIEKAAEILAPSESQAGGVRKIGAKSRKMSLMSILRKTLRRSTRAVRNVGRATRSTLKTGTNAVGLTGRRRRRRRSHRKH